MRYIDDIDMSYEVHRTDVSIRTYTHTRILHYQGSQSSTSVYVQLNKSMIGITHVLVIDVPCNVQH